MSFTRSHGTVYRALAADGTVLYVGMSTQLRDRLRQHEKRAAWWALHDRIECDEPLPLLEALRSEADQIDLLRPAFNQVGGIVALYGPDQTTEREALEWRRRYEAGATVEEISLDARVGTQAVRKHLIAVGTEMRRPGQQVGKERLNCAKPRASASPGDGVVRAAFAGTRAVHRRRGRGARRYAA